MEKVLYKKIISRYKIGKEFIIFRDIEVERDKFQQNKNPVLIFVVNIDKTVVSDKVHFSKKGFKYFICYENDCEKVKSLRIMFPKLRAYRRDFNETKYIFFDKR